MSRVKRDVKLGVTYRNLIYVGEAEPLFANNRNWSMGYFVCSCGEEVVKKTHEVVAGKVTSCGCKKNRSRTVDLSLQTFGKLTVIENTGTFSNEGVKIWRCLCECGVEKGIRSDSLTSGRVISCGCYGKYMASIANKLHGLSRTPEYGVWNAAVQRCQKPENEYFKDYGGRGIKVCSRWLMTEGHGFLNFMEDMGPRPEGMTLDRIDVNEDYCKENCRWVDMSIQAFNKRSDSTDRRAGVQARGSKFTVSIKYKREYIYLGTYSTFEEACKAREEAELKYYGFTKE